MNITFEQYHQDLIKITKIIEHNRFDCIVALKRSGWIIGVYLSNYFDIPVFTESEIKSIPMSRFKKILIVDDKICSGKSINKTKNKLLTKGFLENNIKLCCLYIEGKRHNLTIDYFSTELEKTSKMFYE